ncbi:IS30 family transposase [Actinomyces radicidentis]|uniref:IS30 family transposase n=1 Tax=Actinomyces radicidentis TaxID=111015 RepID=UPI0026E007D7|nr:IS30 family transposase [Actinomyces radicidentis]
MVRGRAHEAQVRARALELVLAGSSASGAARELGLSTQTVTDWMHRAGVQLVVGRHGGSADHDTARKTRVWEVWAATGSVDQAARCGGIDHRTARAWLGQDQLMTTTDARQARAGEPVLRRGRTGGAVSAHRHVLSGADVCEGAGPAGRGRRLSAAQRALIAAGLGRGESAAAIARRIGVCRQTVAREINRGTGADGRHLPARAQHMSVGRLARPKTRKLDANPALRRRVLALLEDRHSPRQIAVRLRLENPDDDTMRVSHEQIYQALYVQGAGSLRAQLRVEKALRSGRTSRLPRSPLAGLPSPSRGRSWIAGATFSLRPAQAADRAVPGHWEGDLIIGGDGRSALVTLVERRSRFLLIRRLGADHRSATVTDALRTMIQELPDAVFETITWDQGVEMASHADFTIATGIPVFFADPHSPWQRPTNENTNGLIREYFPKGTRFDTVTEEQVKAVQDQLNLRARVVLNGMTPGEKLTHIINGATTT